jgi:hypothetical protein
LAYSHWQKKPHFFLSCATGDLKQVLGTCGFWVGYFSIIGAILLDACDIISSQVLLGSLLVVFVVFFFFGHVSTQTRIVGKGNSGYVR